MQTYEAPARKIRGSRRVVVVPLLIGAVIVIAGVAGSLTRSDTDPPSTSVVAPSPDERAMATAQIDCGSVSAFNCAAVAHAARDALADVLDGTPFAIASIRVWPGLICGDDLDCPRAILARDDPVGSAAVTFADRGVAWINVFRKPEPNRLDETREVTEARVIRFFRD